MIKSEKPEGRSFEQERLEADLVVIGGGISGVCAAVTAARTGLKVVLVQDRPVLGGNASSEVRLWILGATSHMGNNNRWAREGGFIDEILVENMYRNPEGNPIIFDTVLLDKVISEPNITLLLNTAVWEVSKSAVDEIKAVKAFCSQNSKEYDIRAPFFCDASGDGVVGFLSGAAFRMGAESQDEFGEKFAPSGEYGELLGHSLYFYSKDVGKPVKFVPPSYALNDITKIPRFKNFNTKDHGCKLWWLEYGGRLDTVSDTEEIKWELWKVAYGAWDYIKNSGNFPDAENLTLEWVGTIPGKRESRRFEGDYILKQQDVVEQRYHDDAVAFGGWSIDLHPADGVFSEKPGCNQWHAKGIYQIPYRCLYSRNIKNLFLAGRIISATHVAFGSSRVMATAAYAAQAVGMAASICIANKLLPLDIYSKNYIKQLQQNLLRSGHFIPQVTPFDERDLVQSARVSASSELLLTELPQGDLLKPIDESVAEMIPLIKGKVTSFVFHAEGVENTELDVALKISGKKDNHTPDVIVDSKRVKIHPGHNCLNIAFDAVMDEASYGFITFTKNPLVKLHYSNKRVTGLLSVYNSINKSVSNYGKQTPPADIGVDEFEFWCPKRRPEGHNIAFKYPAGIDLFKAENIKNGIDRPVAQPNAWVANWDDHNPALNIAWDKPQTIKRISVFFDTDFDHPMETVLMGHPERVMPFCVRNYRIKNDKQEIIYTKTDNYHTHNAILLDEELVTSSLTIEVEHPSNDIPAAIFSVRCYR
jgi:hypothetical protein